MTILGLIVLSVAFNLQRTSGDFPHLKFDSSWKELITGASCPPQTPLATKGSSTGGGSITCEMLDGRRHFKFPVGQFDIDEQVVVPSNTVIEGNANPNDLVDKTKKPSPESQTYFVATKGVTDKDAAYCGTAVVTKGKKKTPIKSNMQPGDAQRLRIGFLMNSHTTIKNINFQGRDTVRPDDNGNLCGGGAFETPGCVSPGFGDGKGVGWERKLIGCYDHTGKPNNLVLGDGKGVEDVTIEDVRLNDLLLPSDPSHYNTAPGTQIAVWVAMTQDGSATKNVKVKNLVSMLTRGDGINYHGNVQNSVVESCHIENTGDDIYAFWGAYARNPAGNVFKNNVGKNPGVTRDYWYGVCIAVYGAKDVTFTGNKCYDTRNWKPESKFSNSCLAYVHDNWFGAIYPSGNTINVYENEYLYMDGTPIKDKRRPQIRSDKGSLAYIMQLPRAHDMEVFQTAADQEEAEDFKPLSVRDRATQFVSSRPANYSQWSTAEWIASHIHRGSCDCGNGQKGRWGEDMSCYGDDGSYCAAPAGPEYHQPGDTMKADELPKEIEPSAVSFKHGRVVGFIENQLAKGQCLDVKDGTDFLQMHECEFDWDPAKTDQIWEIRPDGFIENVKFPGMCVDVAGNPAVEDGSRAQLHFCEFGWKINDQQWTLTKPGFLKSQLNPSKCLDVRGVAQTQEDSDIILYECDEVFANHPSIDPDQAWQFLSLRRVPHPHPNRGGPHKGRAAGSVVPGTNPSSEVGDDEAEGSDSVVPASGSTGAVTPQGTLPTSGEGDTPQGRSPTSGETTAQGSVSPSAPEGSAAAGAATEAEAGTSESPQAAAGGPGAPVSNPEDSNADSTIGAKEVTEKEITDSPEVEVLHPEERVGAVQHSSGIRWWSIPLVVGAVSIVAGAFLWSWPVEKSKSSKRAAGSAAESRSLLKNSKSGFESP